MILHRIYSFHLLLCLAFSLALSGCADVITQTPSIFFKVKADDPPFVAHFKNSIGTLWYEVRFAGVRVGRANVERSIKMQGGEPVYHFQLDEQSRLQILGTSNNISRKEEKYFSTTNPYSLLFYNNRVAYGNIQVRLEMNRISPGRYEVTGSLDREQHKEIVKGHYYGLSDELDLEMWLQTGPEIGDSESFEMLSLGMFQAGYVEASIKEISNKQVNGKNLRNYEILTTTPKDGFGHLRYSCLLYTSDAADDL